jgi:hypothetical protein
MTDRKDIFDEIYDERLRQVKKLNWAVELDDTWVHEELLSAAICYSLATKTEQPGRDLYWPWKEYTPNFSDHRRNLIKAAALIVAEIERLDRSNQSTEK